METNHNRRQRRKQLLDQGRGREIRRTSGDGEGRRDNTLVNRKGNQHQIPALISPPRKFTNSASKPQFKKPDPAYTDIFGFCRFFGPGADGTKLLWRICEKEHK
ncbi:PREDICTED: uncharacterized protein LOC104814311 isoform X2 [Tarenaya hassleriana]|uniref:uncharacterized protein LOC104814311 isoform X2 n=1 Tax=Tarenaya hassleriana TaxID=28532 RepID=UPI00053C9DEF|nr:PREDICTED: uncharacterized protein LOC104814311 isoform X2 [Tarenaya hassleriana]